MSKLFLDNQYTIREFILETYFKFIELYEILIGAHKDICYCVNRGYIVLNVHTFPGDIYRKRNRIVFSRVIALNRTNHIYFSRE